VMAIHQMNHGERSEERRTLHRWHALRRQPVWLRTASCRRLFPIFPLLAFEAARGVRNRAQSLQRNLSTAVLALPEGASIDSPQRVADGKHERFLVLLHVELLVYRLARFVIMLAGNLVFISHRLEE